ncbi:MAG: hypothetical protein JJU25_05515 [Halomonas sp.]|nr:hypothetical protein [Halomonas sp.]MCC5882079.1 hypothetical protein [Halomonas sp.]
MLAAQGKIMKKLLLFVFVWCAITAQADEVDKFINDILDAELTVNYCMSINRDLINGKVLAEIANLLVAARRWL